MASDTDSVAPTEFPFSSSDEDLLEKTTVFPNARKCPLCLNYKRYYLCVPCVRTGDFYCMSNCVKQNSQRFIEKKLALLKVQGEIKELQNLSRTYLQRKNQTEVLHQQVENLKRRIALIKQWKSDVESSLERTVSSLPEVQTQKKCSAKLLEELAKKVKKSEPKSYHCKDKIQTLENQLDCTKTQLKDVIQENVRNLIQCIFPIYCEGSASSDEDSESLATVKDALADASQQTYVRGQWIYDTLGHGNGQHCIAGAILPGTGDMAAYQLCEKQSIKEKDMEPLRHFKVALSHATQLSHILAFYFGVRLPKKVAHRDFISSDLDAKRFSGRISRLQANILFLCTSQGMRPAHLRYVNPLARLLKLLGSSDYDLGRNGPFEFHPELWSFEDIAEEDGSTAIDSSDEEDHDPLNADWESVVHLPPVEAASNRSSEANFVTGIENHPSSATHTSVMDGVVSGVASLWSKWPWSK